MNVLSLHSERCLSFNLYEIYWFAPWNPTKKYFLLLLIFISYFVFIKHVPPSGRWECYHWTTSALYVDMLNRNIRDNVWALSKLNWMILVHFLSSVKIATTALQCYWRESAALGWSWSTTPSRATGRDLTELLQILILSSHLTSSNTHSCPCMLQLEYPPSQHDVCWWWKLYFLAPASVGMSEKFMTWDKWKCSFEFSPQHGE